MIVARAFTLENPIALWTLVKREMKRTWVIINQVVWPPVITTILYVFVFGLALVSGLVMVFVVSKSSLASAGFDPYYFGQMGKSLARGDGFAPSRTVLPPQRRALRQARPTDLTPNLRPRTLTWKR